MPNIGLPEIILILILALIVFGPKKLPEVGRSVGRGLREFRRASQDWRDQIEHGLDDDYDGETVAPPHAANGGAKRPGAVVQTPAETAEAREPGAEKA